MTKSISTALRVSSNWTESNYRTNVKKLPGFDCDKKMCHSWSIMLYAYSAINNKLGKGLSEEGDNIMPS